MRILSWEEFLEGGGGGKPMSATVGVFDGLHVGHRRLIDRVFAHGEGRLSSVFTFRENPKRVVRPSSFQGTLSSLGNKLEDLEALGLDICVLIDFSGNFSKLAGKEFLSFLREKGNLEYIAVGSNFSCGYRLDTDARDIVAFYAAQGILAEILEPVQWEGYAVSSSRIRVAVMDGRLADAEAMLGRPYGLDLAALEVAERDAGRIVFRRPQEFVLPPAGTYEVRTGRAESGADSLLVIGRDRLELGLGTGKDVPGRAYFTGLQRE